MRIKSSKMLCHQVIHIHPKLQHLVIHIFAGCQNHSRINFQGDIIGAAGNQHHTYGLRASAALCQLRLVALRAVSHSNQRAGFIKQDDDFMNPPPALIFRDHLLSNNLDAVLRVDIQHIQRCAALLSN